MYTEFHLSKNLTEDTSFDVDIPLLIKQIVEISSFPNATPTMVAVLPLLERFVDLAGESDTLNLAYQDAQDSEDKQCR